MFCFLLFFPSFSYLSVSMFSFTISTAIRTLALAVRLPVRVCREKVVSLPTTNTVKEVQIHIRIRSKISRSSPIRQRTCLQYVQLAVLHSELDVLAQKKKKRRKEKKKNKKVGKKKKREGKKRRKRGRRDKRWKKGEKRDKQVRKGKKETSTTEASLLFVRTHNGCDVRDPCCPHNGFDVRNHH